MWRYITSTRAIHNAVQRCTLFLHPDSSRWTFDICLLVLRKGTDMDYTTIALVAIVLIALLIDRWIDARYK